MKQQAPVCETTPAPTTAPPTSDSQYDPSGGMGNAAMQEAVGTCDTSEAPTLLDKLRDGTSLGGKMPIDLSVTLGDAEVGVKADVGLEAAEDGYVSCEEVTFYLNDTESNVGTEMSFSGEGVSFKKLGIDFNGMLAIAVDSDKRTGSVEAGTDALKLGYRFQGTDEEVLHFLTVKADAMDILFASALEKAKKQAKEQGLVFGVDLGFSGDFQIIDGDVPSMRIEKLGVDLNAELGTAVEDDQFGEFGVLAKAGVSMESDYAKGTQDDPFTTTTGKGNASVTVTLFGQKFGIQLEGEETSKGTLWEKNDAQNRLLEGAMEGAFMHILKTNQDREDDTVSATVRELHGLIETGWNLGCDQVLAAQGVDPRDVGTFVAFDIYQQGQSKNGINTFYVNKNHRHVAAVIERNEAARIVHEKIIWEGGDAEVDGTWASSGEWSGDVDLQMTDGVLTGNYSGGALVGGQDAQWLTGTWKGDDGASGSFAVQVQDDSNRLSGFWKHDGETQMYDWILEKKQ